MNNKFKKLLMAFGSCVLITGSIACIPMVITSCTTDEGDHTDENYTIVGLDSVDGIILEDGAVDIGTFEIIDNNEKEVIAEDVTFASTNSNFTISKDYEIDWENMEVVYLNTYTIKYIGGQITTQQKDTSFGFEYTIDDETYASDTYNITIMPTDESAIEHLNYINDRSFSMQAYSDEGFISSGTGWIYDKVSTTDNPYDFYIATNFHVWNGFITNGPISYINFYVYDDVTSDIRRSIDSITVSVDDINEVMDADGNPMGQLYEDGDGNIAQTDFSLIEVDFSSAIDTKWNQSTSEIVKRFDKFNEMDHVNQFATEGSLNTGDDLYVLGFPGKTNGPTQTWSKMEYNNSFDSGLKSSGNFRIVDNYYQSGTQCYTSYNESIVQMTSGSSGSMVINGNNEIVGIYWGMWLLPNESYNIGKTFTALSGNYYQNDVDTESYNLVSKINTVINK